MTGIEATGEVPGLRSVASTQIAPASASARAGAVCSPPSSSAPGRSTAAQSAAASGATSSGCRQREVVDRARARTPARPAPSGARRTARRGRAAAGPCRARSRPCGPGASLVKATRLDEDVERVDVARCARAPRPRPSRRPRSCRAARRGRTARSCVIGCGTRAASARPRRAARASPRARARSPSCPRTPSCRGGASPRRAPRPGASTVLVARLGERARRRRDAAARAGDLLVRDAGHLALVLLRAPAREGQVGVAVDEAGEHGAAASRRPARRRPDRPRRRRSARRRASRRRPRAELRRAVVAQVGEAGLGRAQHLRGAAQQARARHVRHASPSIGMRTPSRSAASIASG